MVTTKIQAATRVATDKSFHETTDKWEIRDLRLLKQIFKIEFNLFPQVFL